MNDNQVKPGAKGTSTTMFNAAPRMYAALVQLRAAAASLPSLTGQLRTAIADADHAIAEARGDEPY